MGDFFFPVVIEKEPDDPGYLAYVPSLPGCHSCGSTVEEARVNILEATQLHVASLLEHGDNIPQMQQDT